VGSPGSPLMALASIPDESHADWLCPDCRHAGRSGRGRGRQVVSLFLRQFCRCRCTSAGWSLPCPNMALLRHAYPVCLPIRAIETPAHPLGVCTRQALPRTSMAFPLVVCRRRGQPFGHEWGGHLWPHQSLLERQWSLGRARRRAGLGCHLLVRLQLYWALSYLGDAGLLWREGNSSA
jgi:hypothetical protein